MPFSIKFALSVAVALAALGGWLFMGYLDQTGPQWALVFLGPFMVVSLWIFPEVMRTKGTANGATQVRRSAG